MSRVGSWFSSGGLAAGEWLRLLANYGGGNAPSRSRSEIARDHLLFGLTLDEPSVVGLQGSELRCSNRSDGSGRRC